MKHTLIIAGMLLFGTIAIAQQNFTLYNMPYAYQRTYQNPALVPKVKVHIGLPAISSTYLNLSNSGAALDDILVQRPDDSVVVDFGNFIAGMKDDNAIRFQTNHDIFSLGIKISKNYFSLNVTEKFFVEAIYPKTFFEFLFYGNGNYLGEEMDFGIGLTALHYREYGLSYTRELFDRWSVGARVKYLYGMENIWTERSKLSLYTDPDDFSITATSDFLIHTAGLGTDFDDVPGYLFNKGNTGLGLDIGASFQLNNRFSFSAAVSDIGRINWKEDAKSYMNANGEATFTFSGFDLNQVFDDSTDVFGEMLDSMAKLFDVDSTFEAYKSTLPIKAHVGGRFNLNDKFNVGLVLYGMYYDKNFSPGLSASINVQLSKILSASLNYSIYNNSFANIGTGFTLNAGPVQWYLMSDNILGAFRPFKTKNFHLQSGINLVFGKQKLQKEDPSS